MSGLPLLKMFGEKTLSSCRTFFQPQFSQVRTALLWADWRMKKDVRKRKNLTENSAKKLRILALKRNNTLPIEIREVAGKMLEEELPRDALGPKIRARCAFTSRANGNVLEHRVSRIVYRDLADHNRLSGIQRALW